DEGKSQIEVRGVVLWIGLDRLAEQRLGLGRLVRIQRLQALGHIILGRQKQKSCQHRRHHAHISKLPYVFRQLPARMSDTLSPGTRKDRMNLKRIALLMPAALLDVGLYQWTHGTAKAAPPANKKRILVIGQT